jgi:hypothetical protein
MAHGLIDSPTVDDCPGTPGPWARDRTKRMGEWRAADKNRGECPPNDPEDAPETPPDEPEPAPVQDPPEPDAPPYVVVSRASGGGAGAIRYDF